MPPKFQTKKLFDRFRFLFSGKCPHCGRTTRVIRKPVAFIDTNETALRQDRERRIKEESLEKELPHPIIEK